MRFHHFTKLLMLGFPLVLLRLPVFANSESTPDVPIGHCYHWLKQTYDGRLTQKYEYAKTNQGAFSFQSNATGINAVEGRGIYCAKTPYGSTDYGDRVIRIDLVPSVVMEAGPHKICGVDGHYYKSKSECDNQPADIKYSSDTNHWYIIKNPLAIASWSANSDLLISDLRNSANELPPNSLNRNKLEAQILYIDSTSRDFPKIVFVNEKRRRLNSNE
ncbi:MAG: hypothetical protein JNM39_10410 [Bdellovibrionaceae bacterium]|nr:hypothetical protein [Pseudobdellovibrionaceae bacterium]